MPFRLLGLAVDPRQAGEICGRAFPWYAASGVEITLAFLAATGADPATIRRHAAAFGVRDLVLCDASPAEHDPANVTALAVDLFTAIQPHVVVADGRDPQLRPVLDEAFARARHMVGGSAALPAKLYYRASVSVPTVTTAVRLERASAPELFIRAFPQPWVSGLLERDLFAGIPGSTPELTAERRAA